jgi:hypothetical protein
MNKQKYSVVEQARQAINSYLVRGNMLAQFAVLLSPDKTADRRRNANKLNTQEELKKIAARAAIM